MQRLIILITLNKQLEPQERINSLRSESMEEGKEEHKLNVILLHA